jgi:hypothetical protein
MPNLLSRNCEKREDLYHYTKNYIHHFRCQRHLDVGLKALENISNALKDVNESVLDCPSIRSCLRDVGVTMAHSEVLKARTESSTPTPVKIIFAGEITFRSDMRCGSHSS